METTLGQQYKVGEKPTVIMYTYINRHAGTPEKTFVVSGYQGSVLQKKGYAFSYGIYVACYRYADRLCVQ